MTETNLRLATLLLIVTIASSAVVRAQSGQPQTPSLPANAIPARVVEDPSVRVGWRRYEIGSTPTLSLIFPNVPGATFETVQGQLINTYVSANDSGVYAAVRIDRLALNLEQASEEAKGRYFRTFFQGFAQGFQKGAGPAVKETLELLEVTQVTTATGRTGYQQRLTLGSAQGRGQMMFVGNSAFAVVALWFPHAPTADNESFFSSFRIN